MSRSAPPRRTWERLIRTAQETRWAGTNRSPRPRRSGEIEVWEIHNFTADAHPIHIHEITFEVVDRQPIGGGSAAPAPGEAGRKDTVIAYPGEITRVKALFDRPGLFVWHCHIVEHEDNEMMRPYRIGP